MKKEMKTYVQVNNFRCKKCGEIGLSLSVHDFHGCLCGNFVDGGFDYIRRGGKFEDMETLPLYWLKENTK